MKYAERIIRHAKALESALQAQTAIEQGLFPLVLYFGSEEDRDGFISVAREALPNAIAYKLPPTTSKEAKP